MLKYKIYTKVSCVVVALLMCFAINSSAKERTYKSIDMLSTMQPSDKAVVVMVYFGTTHKDTRELTINTLSKKAAKVFAPIEIREAWTSRIVMKRIFERTGEKILNPTQMLEQLKKEGYTHVLLQPINIIEGIEMEAIRAEVENFSAAFKDLRIGDPLLYSVTDVERVAKIIGGEYASVVGPDKKCAACGKCEKSHKGSVVVFAGHGTYTPATATYSMLEYILHSQFYTNAFIGTIEGHPSIEDAVTGVEKYYKEADRLKGASDAVIREVTLVPFMFVAGEHSKKDINGEWKEFFESKGYKVDVVSKGLGELSAIQDIFIEHAMFALKNKPVSILEKKEKYAGKQK